MQLLEVDDGSGWIKVADSQGGKGLVPASYVELSDAESESVKSTSPTSVTPPRKEELFGESGTGARVFLD